MLSLSNADCQFGYRDSIFKHEAKNKFVVVSVTFKLHKHPVFNINYKDVTEELKNFKEVNLRSVRQSIINIRHRKLPDPEKLGNAGSFFKNPVVAVDLYNTIKEKFADVPSYPVDKASVKIPAAWLIQTCGWKGKREGNVGVARNPASCYCELWRSIR